ncbi:MAG TPA: 50S ribosomal protein L35 [Candidatus Omnitrophota bacterium]|mgnify:CR=1 FL=1|jgi:large subunit ribosomal protein L35|nr:50S ribosomal protein L35 [Candidatus Omnitrophota bacterium]HPW65043.1 50S ribosomal protein L35 [Candidatus Omnitrophota bacterium]HQB93856.1 50S ribosomal protein L35 [Candidatus Omnitrophota bacterium]
MPKMKTSKTMRKRFRVTKKGKVLANKTLRRHMMTDRSPKKKRQLRRKLKAPKTKVSAIMMRLPYGT